MDMFLIGAVLFFMINLVVFCVMISRVDLNNPILIKNEQAARAERRELRRQRILKEQLKGQVVVNQLPVSNNIVSG